MQPDDLKQTLGALLPSVNAGLNALCAVLLTAGAAAIRARRVALHRRLMLSAFAVSAVFLICYLIRVALTGTHRFPGEGLAKIVYLSILSSHMVLAIAVPVLAVRAIFLGWRHRYDEHRRVVRYAWPIWMYVSVTGVLVYWMLYHLR